MNSTVIITRGILRSTNIGVPVLRGYLEVNLHSNTTLLNRFFVLQPRTKSYSCSISGLLLLSFYFFQQFSLFFFFFVFFLGLAHMFSYTITAIFVEVSVQCSDI